MSVECGSQAMICEYPIRTDTYRGCSHACAYCFAKRGGDISKVRPIDTTKSVQAFIDGRRNKETSWCDFDIPLHWGGMSDPFQPVEEKYGVSLKLLKLFAETGYPYIVSTKGRLVADKRYVDLIRESRAVVQVSMACGLYDSIEPGAPSFCERLGMAETLAGAAERVVARIQPFIPSATAEIIKSLRQMRDSGVHSVTVEGIKYLKKAPGTIRVGGDYAYPEETLRPLYKAVKDECRSLGMGFFAAENRLRSMGDSTACCGCGDIPGFSGNRYNAVSLSCGSGAKPTAAMGVVGSSECFKSTVQTTAGAVRIGKMSFEEVIEAKMRGLRAPSRQEEQDWPGRS